MIDEYRVREAIRKNKEAYEKARSETKGIIVGSPCSLTLNGGLTGESNGKLAYGTDHDLTGEFGVVDPETQEFLKIGIDMNSIKSFSITGRAGDVIQAEIETYEGNWISCPVSALKIEFNDIRASEFNVKKFSEQTTEEVKNESII
jgi:hypothetical protein